MSSSSVRMTRTVTRPSAGRDDAVIDRISFGCDSYAEKIQPGTNSGANIRRVFADALGENERVNAAKRGRQRADGFAHLVTKYSHGLGRARVGFFALKQIANIGAGF